MVLLCALFCSNRLNGVAEESLISSASRLNQIQQ